MKKYLLGLLAMFCLSTAAQAQRAPGAAADSVMITVFLRHQQDKSLKQIQEVQEKNNFWGLFPPKETRVVSWYVMMGIGQVVTLKVAPKDVRTLNLAIENGAWGAFNTEFYSTYDYKPIWRESMEKRKASGEK
ncbi:hypothetical protein [Hymenobacter crusticola]|uniref:Uncharacterized protein n=1 Tax=Hymenobacter crusticola TaxID=1770526 RepID=A0A243W9G1_9BACT|nr:hypothetical protein [Hymenobacter crusticola]OUJ71844.1 hypothetical protein BXP70_21065 [Hymenobacter crusticola]